MPNQPLDDAALDQLFRTARTFSSSTHAWQDRPVSIAQLEQIWSLARLGPTQSNTSPGRIVWVVSPQAKARLVPLMDGNNKQKTQAAPATAIIGADLRFHEKMPYLFPHVDGRQWFEGASEDAQFLTAWRSSSLQGAWLIMAARALGLDCGPMSGFDAERVTAEFFAGTQVRANFICNIGYGDRSSLHPRNPRLAFGEACRVL